jgi:hypothetical protein
LAKHKIIILMPSFNELKDLKKIILEIKKISDVLVLDDCSTDKTSHWLKTNKISHLKNKKNLGYTKNILNGMKYTLKKLPKYDYILTMDADGEHKASNIKKTINLLKKQKRLSMIVGVRNKKNRYIEKILSKLFFYKYGIFDPLSGFKVYQKDFLKNFIKKISDRYFLIDFIYYAIINKKTISHQNIKVSKRLGSSKIGNVFISNLKLLVCFKLLFYRKNTK